MKALWSLLWVASESNFVRQSLPIMRTLTFLIDWERAKIHCHSIALWMLHGLTPFVSKQTVRWCPKSNEHSLLWCRSLPLQLQYGVVRVSELWSRWECECCYSRVPHSLHYTLPHTLKNHSNRLFSKLIIYLFVSSSLFLCFILTSSLFLLVCPHSSHTLELTWCFRARSFNVETFSVHTQKLLSLGTLTNVVHVSSLTLFSMSHISTFTVHLTSLIKSLVIQIFQTRNIRHILKGKTIRDW